MDTLNNIRKKCFFGLMLTGGLTGMLERHWVDQAIMFNFFCGLILVGMAAFFGSFLGFFIKNTLRVIAKRKAYTGQSNDGVLIGSLIAALLGVLIQAIFGSEMHTVVGASWGALIGGFIGAFPDEIVPDILRLMYDCEDAPPYGQQCVESSRSRL